MGWKGVMGIASYLRKLFPNATTSCWCVNRLGIIRVWDAALRLVREKFRFGMERVMRLRGTAELLGARLGELGTIRESKCQIIPDCK